MDDTGVLSELDLTALRRAAAMAHTVGGITIRLRADGPERPHVVATVVPSTGCDHEVMPHPAGPVLDSCGFRMAVAKAWCDHRSGRRVALVGQHVDALDIEWSIRPPGQLLGFGGVRTHCGGSMVWAMPSLLAPDELTAVLEDVDTKLDETSSLFDTVEARLVRDDLLDVSVVHVEAPTTWSPRLVPMLDEVIHRLVAASAAAELVASFEASAA